MKVKDRHTAIYPGSKVVIMYSPDDTCVDPKDHDRQARRHYDEISEDQDVIVVWQVRNGDPDGGGHDDTHIFAAGVYSHVTIAQVKKALRKLLDTA